VFAQQQWTDGQLERLVFQQYGTASGARHQLDWQLAMQLIEIERPCKLTEEQKRKLQLAGRGDIKRFFDRYEEVKRKAEAREQDEQLVQEILEDINTLQMTLQTGVFGEDSLLVKSLPNTLTGDQFARYNAMAQERRASHHRQNIERAVAIFKRRFEILRLNRTIALPKDLRQELITLMTQETKPSRKPGPYDAQVLLVQLAHVPEEKLKSLRRGSVANCESAVSRLPTTRADAQTSWPDACRRRHGRQRQPAAGIGPEIMLTTDAPAVGLRT
jgi:hypothetical protein